MVLIAMLASVAMFLLWWFDPRQLALPVCAFHNVTGLHCPGCGATRATHELLHGRLLWALRDNALWILTLPLIVYAVASAARRSLCGRSLPGNLVGRPRFLIAIGVIACVFCVLRNVPTYPFFLLAPTGNGRRSSTRLMHNWDATIAFTPTRSFELRCTWPKEAPEPRRV